MAHAAMVDASPVLDVLTVAAHGNPGFEPAYFVLVQKIDHAPIAHMIDSGLE